MSGPFVLLVGGQKSGKSALAERWTRAAGRPVLVLTPAVADDEEMVERIARHRADRPPAWRTAQTFDLTAAIATAAPAETIVIDALDTWLLEGMSRHGLWTDAAVAAWGPDGRLGAERLLAEVDLMGEAAAQHRGPVVVIAGQPGTGPVATGAGTRRYVDLHGQALRRLRARSDRTFVVVAGGVVEVTAPSDDVVHDTGIPRAEPRHIDV